MDQNKEPLVSIVIPVYNAEEKLSACLDSVLLQDYSNYEVILVDDGSYDSSPDICKEYKHRHPESITFVSQVNGGPSVARNKGIELSQGKYIAFVDSDDTVDPNMISTMARKAEEEDTEMVICAYRKVAHEGQTERTYTLPEGLYVDGNERKVLYSLLNERPGDIPPYSWVRLTKRSVFEERELCFSERLYRSEDYHFWVKVHSVIRSIYLLSQTPLYSYFENESSVTHNHVNGYWNDVHYIYSDLQKSLADDVEISEKLDIMLIKRSLIALNNAALCKNAIEAYHEINQVVRDEELNCVIKKTDSNKTAYFVRYRTLMSKGLKAVVTVKYLIRWLKGHR